MPTECRSKSSRTPQPHLHAPLGPCCRLLPLPLPLLLLLCARVPLLRVLLLQLKAVLPLLLPGCLALLLTLGRPVREHRGAVAAAAAATTAEAASAAPAGTAASPAATCTQVAPSARAATKQEATGCTAMDAHIN